MLNLNKHYLNFFKNILISKNNIKSEFLIIKLLACKLDITTQLNISNNIIASCLLFLITKQYPNLNIIINKCNLQLSNLSVYLDLNYMYIFLNKFLSLWVLTNNISFIKKLTIVGKNKIKVTIFDLCWFPEIYTLFYGNFNNINRYFKLQITFYFLNTKNIKKKLLKLVLINNIK